MIYENGNTLLVDANTTMWKFRTIIVAATIAAASAALATPIPKVTKAVLTAEGKAVIEVNSAGSSNSLYMYQIAVSGKEKDCKDTSDAKESGGCLVAFKGKNIKLYTTRVIGKDKPFKYRVLAFDPSGNNPKNSGWSSWQTLYAVSGIQPPGEVKKGQSVTFNLNANGNPPSTLKFTLYDANCVSKSSSSFTCTPQVAGSKKWTVADKTGGVALATGTVTISEQSSNGICRQAGAYNPDPETWWKKWQTGASKVNTAQLRDGKVSSMSPAEIIYWSSKENSVNPVLAMAKIQGESSLIEKRYSSSDLQSKLFMATGYGAKKNQHPWKGFYPQVVGLTYQIDLDMRKNGKNIQTWFNGYTQDNNAANYATFTGIYKKYAVAMNKIAGTNYSSTPNTKGYLENFNTITVDHVQRFLNSQNGELINSKLFCNDHQ